MTSKIISSAVGNSICKDPRNNLANRLTFKFTRNSGAKVHFLQEFNVAAEAATHKDYLSNNLIV
jgi:hypothetical protein